MSQQESPSRDHPVLERLLSEGDYWAALGLTPEASVIEINIRVRELQGEHPDLELQLAQAENALIDHRLGYSDILRRRDETCARIQRDYGPEALQIEGTDPPHTWRAALRHSLEDLLAQESAYQRAAQRV
jgi:hypothetical protein